MKRPIKGFEDLYSITQDGDIISERNRTTLKPSLSGGTRTGGYLQVTLCDKDKKRHTKRVHRLVAETFLGDSEGSQVNHKNGVKTDNSLCNLEWVTASENIQHAFDTGLKSTKRGFEHHNAKFTPEQVKYIRSSSSQGISMRQLARELSTHHYVISSVVHRRTYIDA